MKNDVFRQYMPFLTETALRKWFSLQKEKLYPQNFYFETFSINIGEKSQSFKKISFVFPELLGDNLGGR